MNLIVILTIILTLILTMILDFKLWINNTLINNIHYDSFQHGAVDDMGTRIDELEKCISDLLEQA